MEFLTSIYESSRIKFVKNVDSVRKHTQKIITH